MKRMKFFLCIIIMNTEIGFVKTQSTTPLNSTVNYSMVWSMAKDAGDHYWLGTSHGVFKLDGNKLEHFTTCNSGLSNSFVRVILPEANGNIWIGTDGGLNLFTNKNWISFNTSNGLGDNHVNCILKDHEGKIWVGTQSGLSKFDGIQWTNYHSFACNARIAVRSLAVDHSNQIWIGTSEGLYSFKNGSWYFHKVEPINGLNLIENIYIDDEYQKWIVTGNHIYLYCENSSLPNQSFGNGINTVTIIYGSIRDCQNDKAFPGTTWSYVSSIYGYCIPQIKVLGLEHDAMYNPEMTTENATETNLKMHQLGDIRKIQEFLKISRDIVYLIPSYNGKLLSVYNGLGKMLYINSNDNPEKDIETGYYAMNIKDNDGNLKILDQINF